MSANAVDAPTVPTGAAGGALTGNYPNPGLSAAAVVAAIAGQAIAPASVTAPNLMTRRASTPNAGVALINNTQNLVTWTAPNDGAIHEFQVAGILAVTVLEVGGTILVSFTDTAGNAATSTLFAAAQGPGDFGASLVRPMAPNTTVTVSQSTALTAGAATVWVDLLGT